MTSACKHPDAFLCPFCGSGYYGGLCGHVGVPKLVDCAQCKAMYAGLSQGVIRKAAPPNRVVIEIGRNQQTVAVRAERPDDVVVIIHETEPLRPVRDMVFGSGGSPISKLEESVV